MPVYAVRVVRWPEAWRQNLWQLRILLLYTPCLLLLTIPPPQVRINSKMARELPRRRRAPADGVCSNPPSPQAPRAPQTMLDTPRRARLLADARLTAGKLPRTQLFKIHNVANRTGYRVIKEGTARRSERVHNRDRKPVLTPYQCEAIETVEDTNFGFASSSHFKVAQTIGLAKGSERVIQRNMANSGVGIYRILQKKWLPAHSIKARNLWTFEHRYHNLEDFKKYQWCDESYFVTSLQRQALVHRRCGQENREKLSKTQYKLKRKNQTIHVYTTISWNFKGTLHFYTGTGKGGRLIQADYIKILEEVVAPEWDENLILIEDNDGPHGTKGVANNKVKQAKIKLNIKWQAQPSNSPDLNPIETIWRIIKQRLKSRGSSSKLRC